MYYIMIVILFLTEQYQEAFYSIDLLLLEHLQLINDCTGIYYLVSSTKKQTNNELSKITFQVR